MYQTEASLRIEPEPNIKRSLQTRWEEWAQANVDKDALYRHVPRPPAPPREPRCCTGCKAKFMPANGNQVWCSVNCRSRHVMKRKRMRDAKPSERPEQGLYRDDLPVLV